MELKEIIKKSYVDFWHKAESLVDEQGWIYTKEAPHLTDSYFEHNTGKEIEFQKSFGFSGTNPNWTTKGSRWRPKEISIFIKENG